MIRLRDRVIELLRSRAGKELCGACVGRILGVTLKRAHDAVLKLEVRESFTRHYALCSMCRKLRMVAGADHA